MRSTHLRLALHATLALMTATAAFSQEKSAQAPAPNPCPQLTFTAPTDRIFKEGEQISLSAGLAGGDAAMTPTFVWTVSGGTISGGQGTRNIKVDSTGAGNDRQITVDLWIGGYPAECPLQANASVKVVPPPIKVIEFGDLPPEKETEHIKTFVESSASSSDNIYVFGYAGRTNPRGFSNLVLKRIKTQLLANGISYQRLAFIDGGYREEAKFEFWYVPIGADTPRPQPTLSPRDIVFPKVAPVKKP